MTHTPPRRNNNLPPFEQLRQSNQARQENIQGNPTPIQWNSIPDNIFSNDMASAVWPGQTYNPYARRINPVPTTPPRKSYPNWYRKNREARADELNSNRTYFAKQGIRSKSIEYILLEAICLGQELKTKTTWYRPKTKEVWLMGSPIVKLDDNFRITEVNFPEEIKQHESLLRHRLRQLGLSCLSIKKHTRLYLTDDYYVFLSPGKTVEISAAYNKICLPSKWYGKAVVELPTQLPLNLDGTYHTEELKAFEEVSFYGHYTYHLTIKGSQIIVEGRLSPTLLSQQMICNSQVIHIKTRDSVIPNVIRKIREELNHHYTKKLEEEKLRNDKHMWNDFYTTTATTGTYSYVYNPSTIITST